MNTFLLPRLLLFAVALTSTVAGAQNTLQFQSESAMAVVVSPPKRTANHPYSTSYASRFQKRMPQTYSGFAIEVTSSDLPLRREDPVFRKFGNVFCEKLVSGGYSYLIQLNFGSKESAVQFLNTVIVARANEARLFEYKEGSRKVVENEN